MSIWVFVAIFALIIFVVVVIPYIRQRREERSLQADCETVIKVLSETPTAPMNMVDLQDRLDWRFSTMRMFAICNRLEKDQRVKRVDDGGIRYFSLRGRVS